LTLLQRAAKRTTGKLDELLHLLRGGQFHFELELLGALAERFAHPFVEDHQRFRLILRYEADEERQVLVLGNRPLADEALLLPEPIEPAFRLIVEEKANQRLVVTVKELEGNDLVR